MKDRREETIEKIVKKVVEMSDEEFHNFLEFLKTIAFPGTQYIRILKFYGDGTWGHGGNVTHWMPLPEPPKEANP